MQLSFQTAIESSLYNLVSYCGWKTLADGLTAESIYVAIWLWLWFKSFCASLLNCEPL